MPYAYRCSDCGATFRASRKRCGTCGTVSKRTEREHCADCGSRYVDAERQVCRACGSTDVERIRDFWQRDPR